MNSGIIKKARYETGFVQIPNTIAQSADLSAKEKGIMLCLLSLPDDWTVYKTQLHRFFSDGRDSIINGFNSLIEKGYIQTERVYDSTNGQFIGHNYFVSPIPGNTESAPIPENPKTGNPIPGNPIPENTVLTKKNSTKKIDTKKEITKADLEFDLSGMELPFNEPAFLTAWESWILHRRQIRKKLSRLGAAAQLKKLTMQCPNGNVAADWIIHSIASGYQGIFPPKQTTSNNGQHYEKQQRERESFERRFEQYKQMDERAK